MNLKMKSLIPFGNGWIGIDIFGYVSHGIPGIEIVGLGKNARSIKEKFIYLTREKKLKIPKRRFVLCIDGEIEGKKFKNEEFRYLELPLLIMFWTLSGKLAMGKLDDCFAAGRVSVDGEIENLTIPGHVQFDLLELINGEYIESLKIIAPEKDQIVSDYYHLSLEGLMGSVKNQAEANKY
jgi:hypothetical protein